MLPIARRSDLLVQRTGGDVLVYDAVRDQAHALTPLAAYVYEHADGTRDVAALAAGATAELGTAVEHRLVEQALQELDDARLLTADAAPRRAGMPRREALRRLGAAAAIPLVTSLLVPAPALARSVSATGADNNGNNGNNGNHGDGNNGNGNGNAGNNGNNGNHGDGNNGNGNGGGS